MALDSQFLDWFNATIIVENVLGSSSGGYGGRKYAVPALNVLARLEQFLEKVQSHEGIDVNAKGRIFAAAVDTSTSATRVTIRPNDRITIPSGYIIGADTQPRIVNVEQHNDEAGDPAFFEVLV